MITIINSQKIGGGKTLYTFIGTSKDTKPVETCANGSMFYEMDTSINHIFSEEDMEWYAQNQQSKDTSVSTYLTALEVIQMIKLATDTQPISRIVVEDAAEVELKIEEWNTEYVIPGTSLESLSIELPETTPTALSAIIKVTILGITRHADPEDEFEDPLLLSPTIILPEGLYVIGGFPEMDGDRWVLTIDNNMTATAMVIPAPPVAEDEGEGEQEGGE